jgi:hypothetical protein
VTVEAIAPIPLEQTESTSADNSGVTAVEMPAVEEAIAPVTTDAFKVGDPVVVHGQPGKILQINHDWPEPYQIETEEFVLWFAAADVQKLSPAATPDAPELEPLETNIQQFQPDDHVMTPRGQGIILYFNEAWGEYNVSLGDCTDYFKPSELTLSL